MKSCGVAEPLCGNNVRQLALGLITYADGKRTFPPDPRGAPSRAITDAMGSYRWRSSREIVGAKIGKPVVSVSTFRTAAPDADSPRAALPEKAPPRFNGESDLRAEVAQGGNTIDFPLESSG